MPASPKYLDPETIAGMRGLELRAKAIVAGAISGLHRSAYHGFSVEFAEHRQYAPGDDTRYIDWRVFGRVDRFYIKEYEEETNLRCNILLDGSASMRYGSGPLNKWDYSATLAASLAYLLIGRQDATGLITFDHEIRQRLPAATGRTQLRNIVTALEGAEPSGETQVKILFHRLAEELRRRSMVILISDLLADPDAVVSGLEHIAHARHELIVFHVMDDHEWNFPFVENTMFEGMEDDTRLLADPQALRANYMKAVTEYSARVRTACLKNRADYVPVNTRDPLDVTLCAYLARRAGRMAGGRS